MSKLPTGDVNPPETPPNTAQPISIAHMQETFGQQAQRLQQQAFAFPPHRHILAQLLTQVGPVDFRQKAQLEAKETSLKTRHYLIIVAEELVDLARRNNWGLARRATVFYLFNGAYWKSVETDELKAFLRQAAEQMGVDKYTARYVGFAQQLFDQFTQTAYLPLPPAPDDTVLINLTNGTFAIRPHAHQLGTPQAAHFLTHQLPFAYQASASAPCFARFLDQVLPDKACQALLAEYLGSVFVSTHQLKLEKVLLLHGSGANGKSVFFEIVTALLGQENISHYALRSLTNDPAYCRAHLANKLLNYASEINGKLEADTFKQLASGEPIEARLPHGQPFIMTNYAKLLFNCNELPTGVEHSPAYFRRFLIVPFSVTIPEADQDKALAARIIATELSGVFNWVLAGLARLLRQGGFTPCAAVQEQGESYQKSADSVRLFLEEQQYRPSHCPRDYVLLKDFYREYRAYCSEDGLYPVKKPNFQKRLHGIGIQTERRNRGNVVLVRQTLDTDEK